MSDEKKGVSIGIIGTGESVARVIATLAGDAAASSAAAAQADAIDKAPDMSGPHGRAWMVDLAALRAMLGVSAADDGTLVSWVVEAPWAHPMWHSYAISLMHLRPLPDGRPTKFYVPNATHELWVYAMDPDKKRAAMIAGAERGYSAWMQPINFAAQIIEPNDAAAVERIEAAVRWIVDGKLSPDTDYLRQWCALFNGAMVKG